MYVADRDTYDDVFCMDCGRIADRETLNDKGICEDCTPTASVQQLNDTFRKSILRGKASGRQSRDDAGRKGFGKPRTRLSLSTHYQSLAFSKWR